MPRVAKVEESAMEPESNTRVEVTRCPKCQRSLRLPSIHSKLSVSCPACRFNWEWSPSRLTLKPRELQFTCAQTGATFTVTLTCERPTERFRIAKILPDLSAPGQESIVISTSGDEATSSPSW